MPVHLHQQQDLSSNELSQLRAPISLSGDANVVLETIKRGDDDDFSSDHHLKKGSQTVILRFHDSHGGAGKAKVTVNLPILRGVICDLLERDVSALEDFEGEREEGDSTFVFQIRLKAYEVKTVKLVLDPMSMKSSMVDDWLEI